MSLITGFLVFITCFAFNLRYAVLWGIVAILLNFIPYIGSIFAVAFPVMISLIQYQTLFVPIMILVILTTIEMILGNLLEPKFQSQGANLSSIVVFTSLLVWGYIWGISGIFLAVPLMSSFNVICENLESLRPIHNLISAGRSRPKKNKNKDYISLT